MSRIAFLISWCNNPLPLAGEGSAAPKRDVKAGAGEGSWLTFFLLLPLALSGCGFEPVYAKREGSALFAGVQVEAPQTRSGQQLRIALEDELNPGGAAARPAYRLVVDLKNSEAAIGVARDGTVSRYNVYLDSAYTLYHIADEKIVTSGQLRHVSSYNNITNQYYSTYVAQEDALKRGVSELGKLYYQRLSAYLSAKPL